MPCAWAENVASTQTFPPTAVMTALRRHRIDSSDTGPPEEVVKYVGREMLIGGDPGDKLWHTRSQWV